MAAAREDGASADRGESGGGDQRPGEEADDPDDEAGSPVGALARFVGGLVLIALGMMVSIGVITAVIGVPMMIAGYALYRSSPLSGHRERSVKMDYRQK